MLLDQAERTDLRVTDADVQAAETEAREAAELLAALESQAVDGQASPAEVVEQRELARFAGLRVTRARERAEAARQAHRVLGLAEVGVDVDTLAAEAGRPNAGIQAAARKLAKSAAELTALCHEHDRKVRALMDRAKQLAVEEPSPVGPRASSAHVAVLPGAGISHGRVTVRLIGDSVKGAVGKAADGDADGAVALLAAIHKQPEAHRPAHLFRSSAGTLIECGDPIPDSFAQQVAAGTLVPLTPDQVDAYLRGELDDRG